MTKFKLPTKFRDRIQEFIGLLEQYGLVDEADYLALSLSEIPSGSDRVSYIKEVRALSHLRLECYEIAKQHPQFHQFLGSQGKSPIAH